MRPSRTLACWALVSSFSVAVALGGCSSKNEPGRVIVLGLDGMDPRTVDLLISEGKLPHFARLRQYGAYSRLLSQKPLLSPVIWTTVATGKEPNEHGIGHFVAKNEATGEDLPVTSRMRRVKALWNVASGAGKSVGVVGWWATWPAEDVRGAIVSDHACYHFLFSQAVEGTQDPEGITHPPELFARVAPMLRRPADVTAEEAAVFINVPPKELAQPFSFDHDVSHFKWAYATAESYRKIGLHLWAEQRPELLMTYVEATDSVSHLFGHLFRSGELAGELEQQRRRFGEAVEQMYLYADRVVGDFMEALDDRTTLIVLSDHGFDLGKLQSDPSKTRSMRRVSERFHNLEGILYLYGNRVKVGGRVNRPILLDIAPTVLALLGVPPARDMPGRVLEEVLDIDVPGPRVASYESATPGETSAHDDTKVDPLIVERLRSLGYLGDGDRSPKGPAPAATLHSPQGERNLAALHFEAGRYEEAAQAYERLVTADPADPGLRTSLAGTLGALGRYPEALEQLDQAIKLDPINAEAYHNRGVLLERQGRPKEAADQYRLAVRYNPEYEPSRQALTRLTGRTEMGRPHTAAEARAAELCDQAGQTARRGDYPGAMTLLDQAEKTAPRFALVHQYRSNVAYLIGDRAAAIRALERGLALEPDNALFQVNLKRLREESSRK